MSDRRLEAVVAGARDRAAAAAVVDQGVARLLEHPLLVADDDLGRAELQEPLEAVVAVDDAPVEVVEVGGREAAAVELDHRAQVGRDDRQDREDHPLGAVARAAERLDEAEPLDRLLAALARSWSGPRRGGRGESSSRSIRTMMSRTASAPMPAQKMRPVRAPEPYFSSSWRNSISPIVMSGLRDSISSRARRSSSLRPAASSLRACRSRPGASRPSRDLRSSIFCSVPRSSSRGALLRLPR